MTRESAAGSFRRLGLTLTLALLLPSSVSALSGRLRDGVSRPDSSRAARAAANAAARLPGPLALRGPVDEKQYIVGPGDTFAVSIASAAVDTYRAEVTPEGDIVLPGIATTPVAGLSLADAKQALSVALGRQYHGVDVHIALVELRRIEVHVIGDVLRPGTYVGTALDPTGALIDMAGGLGENASRRNIRVTRRGGDTRRVDLLRYERLGDLDSNPPILDGDVIFVPFEKTLLRIDGAVEKPGDYEFVDGDTAVGLIELAGGLTRDARRDSIEVRRFDDGTRTQALTVALETDGRTLPLRDGDQINIRFLRDYQPSTSVTLEGEFIHPGPYGISEGVDKLSDVIRRAGGFSDDASLPEGSMIRTTGVEQMDLEYERLKTIPVQDMSETEYAYFKSKARERKGLVVVDFQRLADGDTKEDRLLQAGDRIFVPKKRATVKVSGSVRFPGLITYVSAQRASYYIEQAGGFGSHADKSEGRVIRSLTGEWEPLGRAGIIVPGDEIWVPEAAEHNWWQLAQDAVRFAASIATVYLVIQQATR